VNLIGMRTGDGSQLLREIARGARARVYLASDGRRVEAVKAFGRGEEARADRELRFGRGLDHPNVNPVLRRLDLGGFPAVVAPFVPGRRLSAWLPTAGRDERIAAIDGLLSGLAHLHARGIVHRDVKPENLLVTRDGRPVLIDYDLAMRTSDRDAHRTAAGTVAYLSPEQARGEPALPASDLYAAGVLLYRLLTGEVPFAGSVAEVMEGHRSGAPLAPSRFDADLAPFDATVLRLLDKRPEARFAGAEAARRALREAARRR
jgi:serine/threonine protein kinase